MFSVWFPLDGSYVQTQVGVTGQRWFHLQNYSHLCSVNINTIKKKIQKRKVYMVTTYQMDAIAQFNYYF